jgi:peptidoglycan/LPS O-acetylase OafA/YrhL
MVQTMHYRADIDGLRALAIIPVVLFHLGFTFFNGGYIGVDVFFVISGYLITSIIYREIHAGSFSFARFYERRVRRLFPALFAVLVVTSMAAVVLMGPNDFMSFSQSLGATSVFTANLIFWRTAGYFDGPAEMKPLLHAWSLAVEEQFYIFFPILLLLVHRYLPHRVRAAVAGIALTSFAVSLVYIQRDQSAVFYLPIFRAWELLLGVLLALDFFPCVASQRLRDVLSVTGLALICYGVVAFSDSTVFPGVAALFPTLGTVLLIHASGSGPSVVGRLLSVRSLVFIGIISYPLYLWHWPLIVFTKYYLIRHLQLYEKLALIGVAVLLATLTWRFIERPFRHSQGLWSRPTLFAVSASMVGVFLAVALVGHLGQGLPQRFSPGVLRMAEASSKLTRPPCFSPRLSEPLINQACRVGVDGPATFLLWGDSHALVLASAVDNVAKQHGVAGLFVGQAACPPLLGVKRYDREGRGCEAFNDRVITLLEEHREIRRVLLAGRWALNSLGDRYGDEGGQPAVISPDGVAGNAKAFQEGLERTLRYLDERALETVFVAQVPEIGWDVPSVLTRVQLFGHEAPPQPSLAAYQDRQRIVTSSLEGLSSRYRFRIVEVSDILCHDGTCSVQQGGVPLYRDGHHLSAHGVMVLSQVLERALAVSQKYDSNATLYR